jgi:hypothetical protein
MNDRNIVPCGDADILLASLRARFIAHGPYENLRELFDRHVKRIRAAQSLHLRCEARAIALIGAPGSGKTTAVDWLLDQYPDLAKAQTGVELAEVICLQIPSPATLKHVGAAMLHALGYPLQRDRPAAFIWDQVRGLLEKRGTLFVHLDEAQDLHTNKTQNARSDVVNTLKSLMNNKAWPVGLILSGTEELTDLVNSDHQLARRVDVIKLDAVSWEADASNVRYILTRYFSKAGLEPDDHVVSDEFLRRIVHAGANEFGLIVQTIISGIEEALIAGDVSVKRSHFAKAFHRKSGCIPAFNPFLADDFWSIDPRLVLGNRSATGGRMLR